MTNIAQGNRPKSSKVADDEDSKKAADLLADQQQKFRDSRKAVGNQTLKQFEIAELIHKNQLLSRETFLRDCGVPEDDIPVFQQFSVTLRGELGEIKSDHVTFGLIKALIGADETTRRRAILRMKAGAALSEKDIAQIDTWHHIDQMSDDELFLSQGRQALRSAAQRLSAGIETKLRDGTQRLLKKMLAYNADQLDSSSKLYHEIVATSREVLEDFERLFGNTHVDIKEWFLVGLENPEAKHLAQAHYSLSEIAAGQFDCYFPRWQSAFFDGSAFDALNFIAGMPEGVEPIRRRNDPRPVRKLTAIELCAKSGGQALGLEAAGFSISTIHETSYDKSAETLKLNRPDWSVKIADLRDPTVRDDIVNDQLRRGNLDLIAGALPVDPWGRRGDGKDDANNLLTPTLDLLTRLRPRAFFFETEENFKTKRHLLFRDELLRRYDELGYRVEIIDLDPADHGVPQEGRVHTYIIGIEKLSWGRYKSPVTISPVRSNLEEAIGDIAFPHRSKHSLEMATGVDPTLRSRRNPQQRYDSWAANWLKENGKKRVPDVKLYHTDNFDDWHARGITTLLKDELDEVSNEINDWKDLPMTIDLLKRLQGIPDDWTFASETLDSQFEELVKLTPPRLALAIARAIRAALTGEEVDSTVPGALEIKSGKNKSRFAFSLEENIDPEKYKAMDWYYLRLEEERPREVEIIGDDYDDDDEPDDDAWEMPPHDPYDAISSMSSIRFPIRSPTPEASLAGQDEILTPST